MGAHLGYLPGLLGVGMPSLIPSLLSLLPTHWESSLGLSSRDSLSPRGPGSPSL